MLAVGGYGMPRCVFTCTGHSLTCQASGTRPHMSSSSASLSCILYVFIYHCSAVVRTISREVASKRLPVCVMLLHPGTVDTDLSAPFQRGLPAGQLMSARDSVSSMLSVIDSASANDNGSFKDYSGQSIPW